MKTKIEIKSVFGSLLFELKCENNTLKNTVLEAIKRHANLSGANLSGADYNENTGFLLSQCPDDSFIAYKKAQGKIVKIEICEDAKRSSATSLKCRCSKAKCLEIQNIDGSISELKEIRSNHDSDFIYKVGKINEVLDFDEERFNECSSGIHFFISREMAIKYN
jgi:hypothetical protein